MGSIQEQGQQADGQPAGSSQSPSLDSRSSGASEQQAQFEERQVFEPQECALITPQGQEEAPSGGQEGAGSSEDEGEPESEQEEEEEEEEASSCGLSPASTKGSFCFSPGPKSLNLARDLRAEAAPQQEVEALQNYKQQSGGQALLEGGETFFEQAAQAATKGTHKHERLSPPAGELSQSSGAQDSKHRASGQQQQQHHDQVKHVDLFGFKIVALTINDKDRLCLAQISNTLLKDFSYNEIHNRRVALGITCVQCTPIQLEMLRRAGAMPSSSRRCGMITMREAERLCRSFLAEEQPPELPENFYFTIAHRVNYGCKGRFVPARYISSRAKCIECFFCGEFYSPNKFIFHSHKQPFATDCNPPDSPNINSWRKHIDLDWTQEHSQEIKYAWEDVKSLFNGGTRRRIPNNNNNNNGAPNSSNSNGSSTADSHRRPAGPQPNGTSAPSPAGPSSKGHRCASARRPGQEGRPADELIVNVDDDLDFNEPDQLDTEPEESPARQPLSVGERRKMPMGWPHLSQTRGAAWLGPSARPGGQRESPLPAGKRHCSSAGGAKRFAHTPAGSPVQCRQQQQQQQQSGAQQKVGAHNKAAANQVHRFTPNKQLESPLQQVIGMQQQQQMSLLSPGDASLPQGAQQQRLMQPSDLHHHMGPIPAAGQLLPKLANPMAMGGDAQFSSNNNELAPQHLNRNMVSSPASFIYNQLYSQLVQSQQAQQTRPQPQPSQRDAQLMATFDAQLALRHQFWSSLLANVHQQQRQQQQQQQQQQPHSIPLGTGLPNAATIQAPLHSQAPAAYNLTSQQQQQTTSPMPGPQQSAIATLNRQLQNNCQDQTVEQLNPTINENNQLDATISLAAMQNDLSLFPTIQLYPTARRVENIFGNVTSLK